MTKARQILAGCFHSMGQRSGTAAGAAFRFWPGKNSGRGGNALTGAYRAPERAGNTGEQFKSKFRLVIQKCIFVGGMEPPTPEGEHAKRSAEKKIPRSIKTEFSPGGGASVRRGIHTGAYHSNRENASQDSRTGQIRAGVSFFGLERDGRSRGAAVEKAVLRAEKTAPSRFLSRFLVITLHFSGPMAKTE